MEARFGEAAARGRRRTRAVASCLPPEGLTAGPPRHLRMALALPRCAVRVGCTQAPTHLVQRRFIHTPAPPGDLALTAEEHSKRSTRPKVPLRPSKTGWCSPWGETHRCIPTRPCLNGEKPLCVPPSSPRAAHDPSRLLSEKLRE